MTVTPDVKPSIGKFVSPGVEIFVISNIRPKDSPKITIIRIGEYFVPATTALEIKTIGNKIINVIQK